MASAYPRCGCATETMTAATTRMRLSSVATGSVHPTSSGLFSYAQFDIVIFAGVQNGKGQINVNLNLLIFQIHKMYTELCVSLILLLIISNRCQSSDVVGQINEGAVGTDLLMHVLKWPG